MADQTQAEMEQRATEVRSMVKELFKKKQERDTLQGRIEELNKELAVYGLDDAEPQGIKVPRTSYPALSMDAVTEVVKAAGKDGCKAGDLAKHFGPSWMKWRKDNEKKFKVVKEGTTKFWFIK